MKSKETKEQKVVRALTEFLEERAVITNSWQSFEMTFNIKRAGLDFLVDGLFLIKVK